MEIRNILIYTLTGAVLGITNYVRAEGVFPPTAFALLGNSLIGYIALIFIVGPAVGLSSCFASKNTDEKIFEEQAVVAGCTVIVICLAYLVFELSK